MSTYHKVRWSLLAFSFLTLLATIREWFLSPASGMIVVIECLVGIALIFAPDMIRKVLHLYFPKATIYFYWFFLFMSVFLGSCLHLMDLIPFWDKILHGTSPMLLSMIGYGIITNGLQQVPTKNIPVWVFLLFGFGFAGICGVFWEFWEFTCDTFANLNLQRYQTLAGVPYVGRAALMDTMGDLAVNTIGAILIAIYSYIQAHGSDDYFIIYRIIKSKHGKPENDDYLAL